MAYTGGLRYFLEAQFVGVNLAGTMPCDEPGTPGRQASSLSRQAGFEPAVARTALRRQDARGPGQVGSLSSGGRRNRRLHRSGLAGARFEDVARTRIVIRHANCAPLTIEDAYYEGMRIDGILVTELLHVYRIQQPASE